MSGALAASVFDGLLRGHVAEDPVEEAALVARADEDLARAAELEHDAFARRLAVDELAEVSKIPVPASLAALKDKEVRFTKVIDKADMKDYIYSALGI